ncbi:polyisoprenoid-binding protein [Paracoccus aestuarii]|uniref:Polyisoprenoid-binding protein n=1 Tax=Paracoccus aestuarii TaxID=453842 RepID=A0A419A313_9RHOB|nr:YceI family protein [Paracoccus aestuarii]RJL07612.1 polyisoprenoid-binding protein [Paracoccus aestuarii]WCR00814.1 polyisoprenoid-binding protein [Paracoccus aestuarii]
MKTTALTAALALTAGAAMAAPETYQLDTSHSQIVFTYDHLGFSTTTGMFGDITGTITFDAEDPAASSVEATFPVASLMTGFAGRDQHFLSDDFFGGEGAAPEVTFTSTSIEVTGDDTALITGDLTLNGVTREVVLDTTLNQQGTHPMENKPWLGFDATTTLVRSEFNLGMFAPAVSDEVEVMISVEAMPQE